MSSWRVLGPELTARKCLDRVKREALLSQFRLLYAAAIFRSAAVIRGAIGPPSTRRMLRPKSGNGVGAAPWVSKGRPGRCGKAGSRCLLWPGLDHSLASGRASAASYRSRCRYAGAAFGSGRNFLEWSEIGRGEGYAQLGSPVGQRVNLFDWVGFCALVDLEPRLACIIFAAVLIDSSFKESQVCGLEFTCKTLDQGFKGSKLSLFVFQHTDLVRVLCLQSFNFLVVAGGRGPQPPAPGFSCTQQIPPFFPVP